MNFLIEPWKHQLEAIGRASEPDVPNFAFFFEMGAGKTATAINTLRFKFNQSKRVMRTLILCPPIVIPNWRAEWLKNSKIEPGKIVLLTGPGSKRARLFEEKAWYKGEPVGTIFVTNYESLLMPELCALFHKWRPDVLVLDESHRCKDSKTKRTKAAIKLSDLASHKYLLSGSPVLNTPMDLFSQFRILDGGKTFGQNFFAFRATYFRDANSGMPRDRYFPKWELMAGALEAINAKIKPVSMRVLKTECLDLPPLIRQTISVGMTPAQAKIYEDMKRDFVAFMGQDKTVVATLAITKALRLQQIASGFANTVEGQTVSIGSTPKMDALKELLAELTPAHKVLVWAVWKENYEQIRKVCEDLGLPFVEVHGDVAQGDKYKNVDAFNNDPKVRVLIGHPGSGGIGINLVAASYSIFYSRNFSLEHSLQAEARNHRGGSEIHEKITRIDLVCENTIDELVTEKLANKIEISDKVLRDLSLLLKQQI